MGYGINGSINGEGFHLSMMTMDFECPWCEYKYTADWYEEQLYNSKRGLIYKSCKICKNKIGITFKMDGVAVWLKKDENK
jgi:hypothetical protein